MKRILALLTGLLIMALVPLYVQYSAQAQIMPTLPVPVPSVEVTDPGATPVPALPTFVDFLEEAKAFSQRDTTLSVIIWLKSGQWFSVAEVTQYGADYICHRTIGVRGATAESCVLISEIAQLTLDRPSIQPAEAEQFSF